jgi:SAM-dependent methyltransferase
MAMTLAAQSTIDSANRAFWSTLCGSILAQSLGITDDGPVSLKRFDDWFMNFYPYLDQHIDFADVRGKRVLEVGLGYGTIGQRLAAAGADYVGLDIADGPVGMMQHRLAQAGLPGEAIRGSILKPPFSAASFDVVIAIGCLHHTGDLKRAIAECRTLLKPGGRLMMMVYYAYSYRQWENATAQTRQLLWREFLGYRGVLADINAHHRAAYDADLDGNAAPHTDWISKASLKAFFADAGFARSSLRLENIDQAGPFKKRPREDMITTVWPQICGLDLYASAWV